MPELNKYMSPVFNLVKEQYNKAVAKDDYDYTPEIQAKLFKKVEFFINEMVAEREFLQDQKERIAVAAVGSYFLARKLPMLTEVDGHANSLLVYVSALSDQKLLTFLIETCKDKFPSSTLGEWINRSGRYHSPITIAASYGEVDTLGYLVANKAGVNKRNKRGQSAIMCAASMGRLDSISFLEEAGGHLDTPDLTGKNALLYAVRGGHEKVVRYLLNQGIDADSLDNVGQSALLHAAACGHLEICQTLVSWGANLAVVSTAGAKILDAAKQSNKPEIVEYLQSELEKHDLVKPKKSKKSKKSKKAKTKTTGSSSFPFFKRKGRAEAMSFHGVGVEGGGGDHSRAFEKLDEPGVL